MVLQRCHYGNCKSDNRYKHKDYMKGITFHRVPNPQKQDIKWKKWIIACGIEDTSAVEPYYYSRTPKYVCSKHFVGGNGPTKVHPNPVPLDGRVVKVNGFRQVVTAVKHDVSNVLKPVNIPASNVDGFLVDLKSATVCTLNLGIGALNNHETKFNLVSEQLPISTNIVGDKAPEKFAKLSGNINKSGPCVVVLKKKHDVGCNTGTMTDLSQPADIRDDPMSISLPKKLHISTENIEGAVHPSIAEPCKFTNGEDAMVLQANDEVGFNTKVGSKRPAIHKIEPGFLYSPKRSHILISDNRSSADVASCDMPEPDTNPPSLLFEDLQTLVGCPFNWTAFYGENCVKYSYELDDRLIFSYLISKDMCTSVAILENYTICEGNSKKQFCFNSDDSIGNGLYRSETDAFHSKNCFLLIKKVNKVPRCSECRGYRYILSSYLSRKRGPRKKLTVLSKIELIQCIKTLKRSQSYLIQRTKDLKKQCVQKFDSEINLTSSEESDDCKETIEEESEQFSKIFVKQQFDILKTKNK